MEDVSRHHMFHRVPKSESSRMRSRGLCLKREIVTRFISSGLRSNKFKLASISTVLLSCGRLNQYMQVLSRAVEEKFKTWYVELGYVITRYSEAGVFRTKRFLRPTVDYRIISEHPFPLTTDGDFYLHHINDKSLVPLSSFLLYV